MMFVHIISSIRRKTWVLLVLIMLEATITSIASAAKDGKWQQQSGADNKERSPWIDPDTPEEDRKIVSFPELPFRNDVEREFDLVFSDEFNLDGRTMNDGRDPRWTALHSDDLTNNPLHWYSHDAVKTGNGVLSITLDVHPATFTYTDHTNDEIKQAEVHKKINVTKEFRSGMVQSWNKFCFVGGIIEMSAKLPGDPKTGGLWPASECVRIVLLHRLCKLLFNSLQRSCVPIVLMNFFIGFDSSCGVIEHLFSLYKSVDDGEFGSSNLPRHHRSHVALFNERVQPIYAVLPRN